MGNNNTKGCGFTVFLILVIVVLVFITTIRTTEYHNVTIVEKSYAGGFTDGFVIWAQDEYGTMYEFSNKDQWLRGKFDSSTVQGRLRVGDVYYIKTAGFRIPLFSMYENIVDYSLIKTN